MMSKVHAQLGSGAIDQDSSKDLIIQPHSFDDLMANYSGYITNYINVLDAHEGNLLVRVLQNGKRVKSITTKYSEVRR